jgi:hypothetical protein
MGLQQTFIVQPKLPSKKIYYNNPTTNYHNYCNAYCFFKLLNNPQKTKKKLQKPMTQAWNHIKTKSSIHTKEEIDRYLKSAPRRNITIVGIPEREADSDPHDA